MPYGSAILWPRFAVFFLIRQPSMTIDAGLMSSGMINAELSVPFEFNEEDAFDESEL